MTKRSEGVKRIVTVFSVLSVLGWVSFVFIASDEFSHMQGGGWLFLIVGMPIAYFIPQLICFVIYWVIDGFKKDKET